MKGEQNATNNTTTYKTVFQKAKAGSARRLSRIARKRTANVHGNAMQNVRGTSNNKATQPSDTRQSTARLPERLQKNAGASGEAGTTVQPTRLILDKEYTEFVLKKIRDTKQDIRLTVYNWRNYTGDPGSPMSRITREILFFAQSGGRVKILTTDRECYEYLKDFNVEIKIPKDVKTMHTKAIVFDDTGLLLGSHNLTNSAMQSNKEASLYTTEFQVVAGFTQYFDTLWRTYATR